MKIKFKLFHEDNIFPSFLIGFSQLHGNGGICTIRQHCNNQWNIWIETRKRSGVSYPRFFICKLTDNNFSLNCFYSVFFCSFLTVSLDFFEKKMGRAKSRNHLI